MSDLVVQNETRPVSVVHDWNISEVKTSIPTKSRGMIMHDQSYKKDIEIGKIFFC